MADTWHHNVKKYDSSGKLVAIIGDPPTSISTAGSGDGQLNTPTDVAALGDYLYVLEYNSLRIQVFQNATSTKEASFIVDYSAPVTTLSVTENTASLSASDNQDGTGVKSTEYSLDGTTWTPYSSPFTVASGATVYYRSTDNAGNVETQKSQTITGDTTTGGDTGTGGDTNTGDTTTGGDTGTGGDTNTGDTTTGGDTQTGTALKVQMWSEPSTVEKGKDAVITVDVRDNDKVAVAGANVEVTGPDGTTLTPPIDTTNGSGRCQFTFNAANTGNYSVSAIASKPGYTDGTSQVKVVVEETNDLQCLLTILPFVFIIALIALLALAALFLLLRMTRVKIEPRKTLILADGKSTVPVVVSLVNGLGRPAKAKKSVEVAMGTTAGTIADVTIPAGSSSAEATLTSSKEFGPVVISANYGNKTASANVDFKYNQASLDVSAVPQEIPADGTSASAITVRVKNEAGDYIVPLEEKIVELRTTLGRIQSPVKLPPKAQSATAVLTAGETGGETMVTALMGNVKGETKVALKGALKRFCMHCGATMTMESPKCPKCERTPLSGVDVKQCTTCNNIIPEAAKYCDKCGARQPEKAVQPQAQEPKKE